MAAANIAPPASTGGTVTIGCKLPHGLILQLNRMVEYHEPVIGGGIRAAKRAEPMGERVFINGTAHPQNAGPAVLIIGGYAMTKGVSAEFWERWTEQHADADVLNKDRPLLVAFERTEMAEGFAKEHETVRSGQERLDPDKLPVTSRLPVQTAA